MAKSGLTTKWIMWNLNRIVGAVRRSWDSVLLHPSLRASSGLPTQYGTIHSGKNGAHIVPTNPTIVGGVK